MLKKNKKLLKAIVYFIQSFWHNLGIQMSDTEDPELFSLLMKIKFLQIIVNFCTIVL